MSTAASFTVSYHDGKGYTVLPDALVSRVTLADFGGVSSAEVSFPTRRAGASREFDYGSRVKIEANETIVFMGVISRIRETANGGSGGGAGYENVSFTARDYRYAIDRRAVINGVCTHGYDDYGFSGFDPGDGDSVTLATDNWLYASGIRAIFNPSGKSNCTLDPIEVQWHAADTARDVYLFVERETGQLWTASRMLLYLLWYGWNQFSDLFDAADPDDFKNITDTLFDTELRHIQIEGLSLTQAAELICREADMRFREYYDQGEPRWWFYEPNRIDSDHSQMIKLYCPGVGESIDTSKPHRCWSFNYEGDTEQMVNRVVTLSSPELYEVTIELVPSFANSIITELPSPAALEETQIAGSSNPDQWTVFNRFDTRGAAYEPASLRLWTLNELGLYSWDPYDRDLPPDLSDALGAYGLDSGASRFGLFRRPLLPALTQLGLTGNSAGIFVEVSFDGGSTWQPLTGPIINIQESGGIYIAETNLHNIRPAGNQKVAGGALAGETLSLLTSTLNDMLTSGRQFRLDDSRLDSGNSNWQTRLRVTCSLELEQRGEKLSDGGTPVHTDVYDFSDSHHYRQRAASSVLSGDADTVDDSTDLQAKADVIYEQNSSPSIAGTFTLDQIDLGIRPGDIITEIEGRGIVFGSQYTSGGKRYASGARVEQVIHNPLQQKTTLITADDRFNS
jgi:hypothetical protein